MASPSLGCAAPPEVAVRGARLDGAEAGDQPAHRFLLLRLAHRNLVYVEIEKTGATADLSLDLQREIARVRSGRSGHRAGTGFDGVSRYLFLRAWFLAVDDEPVPDGMVATSFTAPPPRWIPSRVSVWAS